MKKAFAINDVTHHGVRKDASGQLACRRDSYDGSAKSGWNFSRSFISSSILVVALITKVQAYPWVNVEVGRTPPGITEILVEIVIVVILRFVTSATMAMPNPIPLIPAFPSRAVPAVNIQDQTVRACSLGTDSQVGREGAGPASMGDNHHPAHCCGCNKTS